MTLLSILLSLILERWQGWLAPIRQRGWLIAYAVFIQKHVKTAAVIRSWPGLLILILPLLIIIGLIQLGLNHILYGIPGWFFNTIILLLCLNPHKLYDVIYQNWCRARAEIPEVAAEKPIKPKMAQELSVFNQDIFAVIFWFCLFGGVGAVIYRAITVWRLHAILAESELNAYFELLTRINQWLDWLPAKLLALSFAVAGEFMPAFQVFIARLNHKPKENDGFLQEVATAALKHYKPLSSSLIEELAVRSLIVWIVILALMTLAAVVH